MKTMDYPRFLGMQTSNKYFYSSVFLSLLPASTQNDRHFCVTQCDLDENMPRKQGQINHRPSEANGWAPVDGGPVAEKFFFIVLNQCFSKAAPPV